MNTIKSPADAYCASLAELVAHLAHTDPGALEDIRTETLQRVLATLPPPPPPLLGLAVAMQADEDPR